MIELVGTIDDFFVYASFRFKDLATEPIRFKILIDEMLFFSLLIERSLSFNDLMETMNIADGLECETNDIIAFYKHECINMVMWNEPLSEYWMS